MIENSNNKIDNILARDEKYHTNLAPYMVKFAFDKLPTGDEGKENIEETTMSLSGFIKDNQKALIEKIKQLSEKPKKAGEDVDTKINNILNNMIITVKNGKPNFSLEVEVLGISIDVNGTLDIKDKKNFVFNNLEIDTPLAFFGNVIESKVEEGLKNVSNAMVAVMKDKFGNIYDITFNKMGNIVLQHNKN